MPIVRFTADAPGLCLAVMHTGVVMAPAVGRLATGEIVAGDETEALAPCRVSRYGRTPFSPMPDHEGNPGFGTRYLPADPDTTAPDGSQVRVLLSLAAGSAAHFQLAPAAVSRAGRHRTVEEIWYILAGRGEMWRRDGTREEVVALEPDLCLTIPAGTSFQFRATGDSPLSAFAVTMPSWPAGSDDEWVEVAPYWPV